MQNQENNSQINTIYDTVKKADSQNIQINQNVAEKGNLVYNKGESEGDINEPIQRRGVLESNKQQTRIYENGQFKEKEYTRAEYEQWEQSIKPIKEANITVEQKSIKNKIKGQYNKDIVSFNGNNKMLYDITKIKKLIHNIYNRIMHWWMGKYLRVLSCSFYTSIY